MHKTFEFIHRISLLLLWLLSLAWAACGYMRETHSIKSYSIPGGQFVHPFFPLVEKLENVPRGHGNKIATSVLLSGILLNPEAKREETLA